MGTNFIVDETTTEIIQTGSGATNDFGQTPFFQSVTSSWIPFIFGGVLLTPVAFFGVLGNILSISVLAQKKMRSSLSVLLIGLSFSDAVVCLSSILVIGLPALFKRFDIGLGFLDMICLWKKFIFPVALTAQTGSTYFTVAVTFERYIAICKPLQSRSICTYQRAQCFTLYIILFSILSNIPRYISYANREEILHTNHTCESHSTKSSKSADTINFIVYSVFMYLIPICTVVIVNSIIIRRIQQQNTARDQLSQHQIREIKLTNMLITVVTVYVFCNIFRLFNAFTKITLGFTYAELVSFTNFLVTLNSAVNYLIYCAFGKTFRQSFVSLFCKCSNTRSSRSLSLRRDTLFESTRKPPSNPDKTESVVLKSIRRLSKDVINFVGRSRNQAYDVNN